MSQIRLTMKQGVTWARTFTFHAPKTPTTWAAATAYAKHAVITPTVGNTRWYRALNAGTSHATTQPTWSTTVGATITDNTITWVCQDSALAPVDLTGATAKMHFRKYYGGPLLKELTHLAGLTMGGVEGTVVSTLLPADSALFEAGKLVSDLHMTFSNGFVDVVGDIEIVVEPAVTR